MARTLTKTKPIKEVFFDELHTAISSPNILDVNINGDELVESIWAEKPVNVERFCEEYIGEALFPVQAGFAEEVIGANSEIWNRVYEGGIAFWGKGSGKDRTIAKLQLYIIYKLMCMKNPQKTLRENYNCSIGDGDAIDCGNISINARQAANVYFKKFKQMLKYMKNPRTKKNWFAEKGVDLRDGYDIQNVEVKFPHNITAHSLNGETNTGEGLNLFFVTIDEFGSFPAEKGFELLDAVRDTVLSRFQDIGKVCVISFKYHHNDPMHVLYEKEKNDPKIYTSRASTWDVNIQRKKSDFNRKYLRNPEAAKMTYECKGGSEEGGYVGKKYMLSHMFNPNYENPIKGDLLSIDSAYLNTLAFKEWFRGTLGRIYAVHVDLAKGKVTQKGDASALALVHVEKMKPKIDEKLRADMVKEGLILESYGDDETRKGVVVDLAFQLVAKTVSEVEFAEIRKFILRLREQMGFNIRFVSYDGYESTESIQVLRNYGVDADVLSVDKNNQAYDLWKELMYQQIIKTYPHSIALREFRELITNDRGLVDHPEKSWDREVSEGVEKGSKDVADCIAGSSKTAYDKIPVESDVFFA